MKEFVEKLMEKVARDTRIGRKSCECVIEDIMEWTEEYNNGWIPCSDRLPVVNVQVIVTAKKDGHKYTTDAYFYNGEFYNRHYCKIPIGELKDSSVGDKVIAWQPLPPAFEGGSE